eukprot:Lithocolla_globosa_v1_NODE_688_length_3433_cov_50.530195.p2 type:complete len:118 gc:universal NODE_688_length_3433_cov_50.530195:538-185(-)
MLVAVEMFFWEKKKRSKTKVQKDEGERKRTYLLSGRSNRSFVQNHSTSRFNSVKCFVWHSSFSRAQDCRQDQRGKCLALTCGHVFFHLFESSRNFFSKKTPYLSFFDSHDHVKITEK